MTWWNDTVNWLNENSGAVTALATTGTVIFTASAAWAAIISLKRVQRIQRCLLDVRMVPNLEPPTNDPEGESIPRVRFLIENVGVAVPLRLRYKFSTAKGASGEAVFEQIAPGEIRFVASYDPERFRERQNITIAWLDPDGRKRQIRRSYRTQGEWDSHRNHRVLLPVDRGMYPKNAAPRYLQRKSPILPLQRVPKDQSAS